MKLRRETSTFDSSGFAAGSLGGKGPEGATGAATPGLTGAVPTVGRGAPTGVPTAVPMGFAIGVDVGLGATGVPTGVDVGRGVPTIGAAFGFDFGS